MAKILFAWELGAGLGHIQPIKALAQHFVKEGHQVYLALQNLQLAAAAFEGMPVILLQAPCAKSLQGSTTKNIDAYGQMLLANGYHDSGQLLGLCQAWQSLYRMINPDIAFFDHSPTALLAARGFTMLKVAMGIGFTVPPISEPLGVFWPQRISPESYAEMLEGEKTALLHCNSVMQKLHSPQLKNLAELYGDADQHVFLSLPEFDHFISSRSNGHYLGLAEEIGGKKAPQWPAVTGKKVYAYLKPFENIKIVLEQLAQMPVSVIFYSNDIPLEILARYRSANICFEQEPLDLQKIVEEADGAIINVNHSTMMQFIFNEVPLMLLPLQQEQQMLAARMQEQGVGLVAAVDDKQRIVQCLHTLMNLNGCSDGMKAIAARYKDFNAGQLQRDFCLQLLDQINT